MPSAHTYIAMDAPARDIRFEVYNGTVKYQIAKPPRGEATIKEWTRNTFQFRGSHMHMRLQMTLTEDDYLHMFVEVVDPILNGKNKGASAWWTDEHHTFPNNMKKIGGKGGPIGWSSTWYFSDGDLMLLPDDRDLAESFVGPELLEKIFATKQDLENRVKMKE